MSNIVKNSFVKDAKSIIKNAAKQTTFYDAEILTAYWETLPEIIERVLPPPLKPGKKPFVSAFVANYPRTNFSEPYHESALLVSAEFNGQPGNYCIGLSVDDDMAMALGREIHGFPKKMARIEFTKNGNCVTGSCSRLGIEFIAITAMLNKSTDAVDGKKTIEEFYASVPPIYNYKYSTSTDRAGYDLKPRLVEQFEEVDNSVTVFGKADVKLVDSPHDPWSELKIVKLLGATYATSSTIVLTEGAMLAEVDPALYLPYSRNKWDS